MSSGHSTMTGFVATILALLLVIAGLVTEWPYWVWPLAMAVLVLGTLALLRSQRRRAPFIPAEYTREPESPLPQVERWECVVEGIPLPTRADDYDCLFSAVIRWRPEDVLPGAPPVNHEGLAVSAVLERARRITTNAEPERLSLTEHVLAGELAVMQADSSGRLLAMAADVRLRLTEVDRQRLEKLATVRKDEAVWEHERKWEMSKRSYLKEDVLKTTGSAVVWWLAKHEEQIDKTVDDIGLLTELASAANDEVVPELFHRFVPELREHMAAGAEQPQTSPSPAPWPGSEPIWEEPAYEEPEEPAYPAYGEPEEPQEPLAPGVVELIQQAMDLSGVPADHVNRDLFLANVAEAARAASFGDLAAHLDEADEADGTEEADEAGEPQAPDSENSGPASDGEPGHLGRRRYEPWDAAAPPASWQDGSRTGHANGSAPRPDDRPTGREDPADQQPEEEPPVDTGR